MRTIGLIGGVSWEGTAVQYQLLNRMTRQLLGGSHSARLIVGSFDFVETEKYQVSGDREAATRCMVRAAHNIVKGARAA